jgi:hypothetical protein
VDSVACSNKSGSIRLPVGQLEPSIEMYIDVEHRGERKEKQNDQILPTVST